MKEQKLYPDLRTEKWAKSCQIIACIGFIYSMCVTIGFHLVDEQAHMGFSMLYIVPAIFVLTPIEFIISLITIQNWKRWSNKGQRLITLLCSIGCLILLVGQTVFNFGFS